MEVNLHLYHSREVTVPEYWCGWKELWLRHYSEASLTYAGGQKTTFLMTKYIFLLLQSPLQFSIKLSSNQLHQTFPQR